MACLERCSVPTWGHGRILRGKLRESHLVSSSLSSAVQLPHCLGVPLSLSLHPVRAVLLVDAGTSTLISSVTWSRLEAGCEGRILSHASLPLRREREVTSRALLLIPITPRSNMPRVSQTWNAVRARGRCCVLSDVIDIQSDWV